MPIIMIPTVHMDTHFKFRKVWGQFQLIKKTKCWHRNRRLWCWIKRVCQSVEIMKKRESRAVVKQWRKWKDKRMAWEEGRALCNVHVVLNSKAANLTAKRKESRGLKMHYHKNHCRNYHSKFLNYTTCDCTIVILTKCKLCSYMYTIYCSWKCVLLASITFS